HFHPITLIFSPMRHRLLPFLACLMLSQGLHAQCSTEFIGNIPFNEVCNTGAHGPYLLFIFGLPGDSLGIMGLWDEPNTTIFARLYCQDDSFHIDPQVGSPSGFLIEGHGKRTGNIVQIDYQVTDSATGMLFDECVGNYTAPFAMLSAPMRPTSVSVSPHPIHENAKLTISGGSLHEGYDFYIFDLAGKVIFEAKGLTQEEIGLQRNGLASGLYHYQIIQSGLRLYTGRLMFLD
ncbi:MAG: T9SS type A sorting domain-containing protein, partial [Bacteroidota bacterium]